MRILFRSTGGVTPRIERHIQEIESPATAALATYVIGHGDRSREAMGWKEVDEKQMLSLAAQGCPIWYKIYRKRSPSRCFANVSFLPESTTTVADSFAETLRRENKNQVPLLMLLSTCTASQIASLQDDSKLRLLSHPKQEVRTAAILAMGRLG